MGFGVPIDAWLRGPLRQWVRSCWPKPACEMKVFRSRALRKKWLEHLSGSRDWQHLLWDVLMFQAWQEAAKSGSPAAKIAADEGARVCLDAA